MLGRRTLAALAALTVATTLGVEVVQAAAGGATPPPPMCWGMPATIVGSGVLHGTRGDDVIVSRGGEVHAGAGDDRICGALAAYGGTGADRIAYRGRHGDYPELRGGPGDDRVVLRVARLGYLYGGPGDDMLRAHGATQWIAGGSGEDLLRGGRGNDHLYAQGGRDEVRGGRGHDVGDGGRGIDACRSVEDASRCER